MALQKYSITIDGTKEDACFVMAAMAVAAERQGVNVVEVKEEAVVQS